MNSIKSISFMDKVNSNIFLSILSRRSSSPCIKNCVITPFEGVLHSNGRTNARTSARRLRHLMSKEDGRSNEECSISSLLSFCKAHLVYSTPSFMIRRNVFVWLCAMSNTSLGAL